MRGYRSLCSEQDLLLVVLCSGAPGRAPSYGWDRMGGQLVVVGQTLLVDSLEILGQLGVPALGRLYAGAALCILVPSLPVVPLADVPRLPSEGAGSEGHLEVLAVGSQHASRVLRESQRVDDGDVLPHVRRITEEPVKVLVSGLLQRKVWPHLVQRHQHVLRIPHDKGVDEPRGELGTQHLLRLVGHVLEKDAMLARPEDILEHPLERRRYRTWYSPQRNRFALCHMRLSLVLNRVSVPDPPSSSTHDTGMCRNDMRACHQAN